MLAVGAAIHFQCGGPASIRERPAERDSPQGQIQANDPAAGMVEEDARRTRTAIDPGRQPRPDPIQRNQRPAVDQPMRR